MQEPNISKERKLLIISAVIFLFCIVYFLFLWPFFADPGSWHAWSTDGTKEDIGYSIATSYFFNKIIEYLFILTFYTMFFAFIIITIKILTIDIMTVHGSNIKKSAILKARISAGIFLFVMMSWTGTTDIYLIFSFLMAVAFIAMCLYHNHWKKNHKDNLLTDILLFKDNFKKSLFILAMITGISDIIGSYFYVWYEGEWADEYYAEDSLAPFLSDFDSMIMWMRVMGIIITAAAIFSYLIFYRNKKV